MVDQRRARVVVGVDGSEPSKRALGWAARQAELSGSRLDAVIVWDVPATYYGWVAESVADAAAFEGQAAETLDKTLHEVLGGEPAVAVNKVVTRGDTASTLLAAAEGAELLVVGNRGHGAFMGALLGSVSDRCVHHAKCPVVVVRESGE